ncbi:MAG: alanine/glycine:cation symporter family protein [Flavobacteriales bacterium]|nr:alanine/glycine:cation symporter family protein [Flavobacteriales bacterium]MDG1780389.1 alanine/glycine:cation symporter family protein [Flavobacteriales bacterium]MDG2246585.1 alanine/glycine:cation symporter family protein [Flavobacteriales bacterium]
MSLHYLKSLVAILFLSMITISVNAQEEEETTLDDRINAVMEPVTAAVNKVIFFSLPIGEEVVVKKWDEETQLYRLVLDGTIPEADVDTESDLLKGVPIIINCTEEGNTLSYEVKDGVKNKVIEVPFAGSGTAQNLKVAGGETPLTVTGSPESFSAGSKYQIQHSNIEIPFVLIWLVIGAVFFTVFFRFVNISGFKHALDVVRGKFDDPNDAGEVSHFQALTAALSGTVGIGNIAGVAVAVSLGGPGATFWMIVAGLLGMSTKFVECTLGVKYRKVNEDGSVSGGPMYYLSNGLKNKGFGKLGKVLAILFAVACIGGSFGGGNMVQINQATALLTEATGGESSFFFERGWIFGVAMSVIVGIIIIGGIKSIARVTDKVVPFMVGIYVVAALIVLGMNFTEIPAAFGKIFGGAFNSEAMYGGLIGVLIQGFRRAAFSNEAGIGSASIAHSAAKTDEPISEGLVSLLEPFIDTVVICTMTALVIVIADYGDFTATQVFINEKAGDLDAIGLTSSAFANSISWFPIVLTVAVILFALSTMISWSYYGLKAWTYVFGESKMSANIYKAVFCFMVIIGSAISAKQVFDFGDAMIFAMCFPNILGLYVLAPEVFKDLKSYFSRVKSGEIKRFS